MSGLYNEDRLPIVELPESAWELIGDDDAEPSSRILAGMRINGTAFHVEGIAVETVDGVQRAIAVGDDGDRPWEERFSDLFASHGCDCSVETIELFGKHYAVFAEPFSS